MLPTATLVSYIWNDAAFTCAYEHKKNWTRGSSPVPAACDECLIETYDEKMSELSDEFLSSIESEGIVAPIIVSRRQKRVYNGHHRLVAAMLLDIPEVPVVIGTSSWAHSCNDNENYPGAW